MATCDFSQKKNIYTECNLSLFSSTWALSRQQLANTTYSQVVLMLTFKINSGHKTAIETLALPLVVEISSLKWHTFGLPIVWTGSKWRWSSMNCRSSLFTLMSAAMSASDMTICFQFSYAGQQRSKRQSMCELFQFFFFFADKLH